MKEGMHDTNWEEINSLMIASFQKDREIKITLTQDRNSQLFKYLQDMRVPLSPYLAGAIHKDPVFYDSLLWGLDMMSISGEEACLPLLDMLIVLVGSRKAKIQNCSRPENKVLISGDDKYRLEKILIENIEHLQMGGLLEKDWEKNPFQAKQKLMAHIEEVTVKRKEVKGKVYKGLYDTIPWPEDYKETDKCILIYRLGRLLGIGIEEGNKTKENEVWDWNDGQLRQEIYHKVSSVIRIQRKREIS